MCHELQRAVSGYLQTFSLSQSKQLDALILEAQVRQVLAILQDAEASSR